MPTYAAATDLRDYANIDIADPDADRVLDQAERDIDQLALYGTVDPTSGVILNPADLSASDAYQLNRATCAQAWYRLRKGDEFFLEGQYDFVSGPDFSTRGTLPRLSPQAVLELRGSTLPRQVVRGSVSIAHPLRAVTPRGN